MDDYVKDGILWLIMVTIIDYLLYSLFRQSLN
jgi:hypothetical protein